MNLADKASMDRAHHPETLELVAGTYALRNQSVSFGMYPFTWTGILPKTCYSEILIWTTTLLTMSMSVGQQFRSCCFYPRGIPLWIRWGIALEVHYNICMCCAIDLEQAIL